MFEKTREAEEQRKAEKHKGAFARAKIRRQLDEFRLTEKLAKLLPRDYAGLSNLEAFNLSDLPSSPGASPAQP
ncbi:MAG: hypothetical protein JO051_04540 [Acidobacteriaceae bacterium]|nr:hypothetical protein [Acidobacteriaceae bacterium]